MKNNFQNTSWRNYMTVSWVYKYGLPWGNFFTLYVGYGIVLCVIYYGVGFVWFEGRYSICVKIMVQTSKDETTAATTRSQAMDRDSTIKRYKTIRWNLWHTGGLWRWRSCQNIICYCRVGGHSDDLLLDSVSVSASPVPVHGKRHQPAL